MRVLIVQEAGRHRANRQFRESLCLKRALERLGVSVVVWGPGYAAYAIPFAQVQRRADVVLLLENWDDAGWVPDLSRTRALRVFWTIDAHVILDRHVHVARTQRVHVVLSSTEGYLPHFAAPGRRGVWFPNAYPADLIRPPRATRKRHALGFCGSVLDRQAWIDALVREFGMRVVFTLGRDMVRAVASFRLHWNRNVADDINFRTFETPGCGTALLTNRTPGLERLFDLDRHLVVYDSLDDLRDKVRALAADRPALRRIAAAGHAHARAHHTYDARARRLLEIVKGA